MKNSENVVNNNIENAITSMSVGEYATAKNLVDIAPAVRVNTNGYPYVTFIDDSNNADNIYFSKTAALSFKEGDVIGEGFFDNLNIILVVNEAGEDRVKLALKGGNRISLKSIL